MASAVAATDSTRGTDGFRAATCRVSARPMANPITKVASPAVHCGPDRVEALRAEAESGQSTVENVLRGAADRDADAVLSGSERLEGGELRLEHRRRHEVTGSGVESGTDQVAAAPQMQKPDPGVGGAQNVAVSASKG